MTTLDHKWVAGFNNAANLVSVELDVPSFQAVPFYVRSVGPGTQLPEGILQIHGDKSVGEYGFPVFIWMADGMSNAQYNFIQDKSPGGNGYSVKMTVRTLIGDSGTPDYTPTFGNFSAVLQLPSRSALDPIVNAFQGVPLRFVVEAAL